MKQVPVADLHVQCSYPSREPALAMSDCCRAPATSAVEDPYGTLLYYRCGEHEGLFRGEERGHVVFSVPSGAKGIRTPVVFQLSPAHSHNPPAAQPSQARSRPARTQTGVDRVHTTTVGE